MKKRISVLLSQPALGFAPWVLLAVIEGPGRVALAGGLALALSVITSVVAAAVGSRPKLLDIAGIVFFGALTTVAALASPGTSHWLGVWAGEVSNALIAVIAGLSIAFRAPFTLAYARETTPREYWNSPLFLRINYVITGVWSAAFLLTAIVGYLGDGPLHQPQNLWTNWIVPIGLVVLALKFTGWYPGHATADPGTDHAHGVSPAHDTHPVHAVQSTNGAHPAQWPSPRRHRPVPELFRPLAVYLIPVGILVAIVGGNLWWVGLVVIAAGVVITRYLHRATVRASAEAAATERVAPAESRLPYPDITT
jgi:hypothetical protein